jgi:hypothetical protein
MRRKTDEERQAMRGRTLAILGILLLTAAGGWVAYRHWGPKPVQEKDDPASLPPQELARLAANAELGSFRADRLTKKGARVVLVGGPSSSEIAVSGELPIPVQGTLGLRLGRSRDGRAFLSWPGSRYYPLDQLTKISPTGSLDACRLWTDPNVERKDAVRLAELLGGAGAKPEMAKDFLPAEYVYINYQRMGEAPVSGVVFLHSGSYTLLSLFEARKVPGPDELEGTPFIAVSRTIDIEPGKEASFTLEEPPEPKPEKTRFRERFGTVPTNDPQLMNPELDHCEHFSGTVSEEYSRFILDPFRAQLVNLQDTLLRNQPERGHLLLHRIPVFLENRRVELDLELGHDQVRHLGEWALKHEIGSMVDSAKGWQNRLKQMLDALNKLASGKTKGDPELERINVVYRRAYSLQQELDNKVRNLEYMMRQLILATSTVSDLLFAAEVASK